MTERPAQLDPLSRVLGGIETQLTTITRTLSEDRSASAQYRTDVRREIAELRKDVLDVRSQVKSVTDDVAEIKPTVASLHQRAMMSAGMAKLAIFLGRFAHVLTALLAGAFAVALERWLGK